MALVSIQLGDMEYFNDLAWLLNVDQPPFIPNSKRNAADWRRIKEKIKTLSDKSVIPPNRKNTTKPASINFFSTQSLSSTIVSKVDIDVFKNDKYKMYSSFGHASTCMLEGVVFPAACYHATVPTNCGGRISLQLQIERNSGGMYPDIYPESFPAGIYMDDDDTLFQFMKGTKCLCLGY